LEHGTPQPPQLSGSEAVFTHCCPQTVSSEEQIRHAPLMQTPDVQMLLQPPQFS
jgi:hypothetical protein